MCAKVTIGAASMARKLLEVHSTQVIVSCPAGFFESKCEKWP